MKSNYLKGEVLKVASERILGRHVSGDEVGEIAFLFDSIKGAPSERAVIAIRAFAQHTPQDTNAFFAHQDQVHRIVSEVEEQI